MDGFCLDLFSAYQCAAFKIEISSSNKWKNFILLAQWRRVLMTLNNRQNQPNL
jgi:hypothetical protein